MPQSQAARRNRICYARRQGHVGRFPTDAAGRAACLLFASGVTGVTEGTSVSSATDGCVTTGAATARALRGFAQGS